MSSGNRAKKNGDAKVIAWLEAEQDRCYTSAVVIAQLACWVRTKEGRQRQALQAWLTRLVDALQGRIHGFNVSVAHVWAEQERLLEKAGQRMPVEDSALRLHRNAKRHEAVVVHLVAKTRERLAFYLRVIPIDIVRRVPGYDGFQGRQVQVFDKSARTLER